MADNDKHGHDHAHDHDAGHIHAHGPHPTHEDDDVELTEAEAKFLAFKSLLIEKDVVTPAEIQARIAANQNSGYHHAARMIAKAWTDPAYQDRMMSDAKAAAIELGIEVTEAKLVALKNTPERHNLVVCTLCSCYPRSLLGEPPAWYVSKAYRSRAVREPRKVLREFGLEFSDDIEIQVHDSNADLRYVVMPMRPAGSEAMSEEQLAALITRDCVVGAALPKEPSPAVA